MKKILSIFNKKIVPEEQNTFEYELSISNQIYKNNTFNVILDSIDNPRFESFHGKNTVFIPQSFIANNPLYKLIIQKFNNETLPKVITYHEFGHAAQTACVNNNQQVHIKGYSSESEGDINYLFNGGIIPNKINNFLIKLFQEGFADCYAGLCLFKETGDIDVFKKISEVRSQRYNEFKVEQDKYFIHPNFNITAAENMGKTIETFIKNEKNIFNLSFTNSEHSIERYIERSVIAGCVTALINELQTNDAFLNHFRKFTKEFKVDEQRLKDVISNPNELKKIINFEKDNGISSFFFELKKRLPNSYKKAVSKDLLKDLLTNDLFKRTVDNNLELKNVVDILYSAGFETIKSKINSIRTSTYNSNKNTHLKLN